MKLSILRLVAAAIALTTLSLPLTAQTEQPSAYTDEDAYDIYGKLIPLEWAVRVSKAKRLVFKAESVSFDMCLKPEAGADKRFQEAIDDYVQVNKKSWLFDEKLKLDRPYTLILAAELKNMFSPGMKGYEAFYERYPDSAGWIEFSAVGFSADRTVAIAYIAHHCGMLCGGGRFEVFEKQNGQWERLRWRGESCAWVS